MGYASTGKAYISLNSRSTFSANGFVNNGGRVRIERTLCVSQFAPLAICLYTGTCLRAFMGGATAGGVLAVSKS